MNRFSISIALMLVGVALAQRGRIRPPSECEKPMDVLLSLVGKEVKDMFMMKMDHKPKSCLLIRPPKEGKVAMKKCLGQFMYNLFNDTLNSTNEVDPKNLGLWYEKFGMCKLQTMKVDYTDDGFDPEEFKAQVMIKKWTGKAQHLNKFEEIFFDCVDSTANAGSTKDQLLNLDVCTTSAIKEYCESIDRPDKGLMWRQGFFSLMQQPKCEGVELPQEYIQYGEDCVKTCIEKWDNMEPIEPRDEPETKQNIRAIMGFAKNYTKKVMFESFECLGEKMKYYNPDTAELNYVKMGEIMMSFNGWTESEKTEVQQALDECTAEDMSSEEEDDEDSMEDEEEEMPSDMMSAMKKYVDMFKDHKKFQRCFAPKFLNTCGFNNDVSKFMYPTMNKYVFRPIIEHMRQQKEIKDLIQLVEPLKMMMLQGN